MSGYTVAPLQQDLFAVLIPWLVSITGLPQANVQQGLQNRNPMPQAAPGFVIATVTGMRRLRTNIDTWGTSGDPSSIQHEMGTEVRIQVDFYGASSQDWAAAFATLWRDDSGCIALAGPYEGYTGVVPICQPLHADEPRMMPFEDTEDQYEQRWTVDAILQYNPVTSDPMQFADALSVDLINVDETYPP